MAPRHWDQSQNVRRLADDIAAAIQADRVASESLAQDLDRLDSAGRAELVASVSPALADLRLPDMYAVDGTSAALDPQSLITPLPSSTTGVHIAPEFFAGDFSGIVTAPVGPRLDGGAFVDTLHTKFKDLFAGYAFQLRHRGNPEYTIIWNWARQPQDGDVGWTLDRQMHVASVSKLLTAWVTYHALVTRGLSPDTPIAPYLPTYWPKGPGVERVTFRHLLTHTSGFPNMASAGDFLTLKSIVASGANPGPWLYQNSNFGLCRVLLGTLSGAIDAAWRIDSPLFVSSGAWSDAVWNSLTTQVYELAVQSLLFAPAGVTSALTGSRENAMGYPPPPERKPGMDSGDLTAQVGGVGWHLSVNDLLALLRVMRTGRGGLSAQQATAMLDSGFGVDGVITTDVGTIYTKGGWWQIGEGVEQSHVYFLPQGRELVVLANSAGLGPSTSEFIVKTYLANLR